MSNVEKVNILVQVESQSGGKRQALMVLGISKSSYYRWRRGQPAIWEIGKDRGTESLPMKKTGYWR